MVVNVAHPDPFVSQSPIRVLSRVFTLRLEQAVTRRLFCIAHRGGPGPENSLEAINASLALGVDAIEIDLWYAGGELLVTHDRRLGRQISGQGTLLDLPRDHLRALRSEERRVGKEGSD